MAKRNGQQGITLLELLTAIAVMAMIAVGLSSLFDTGGQVWRRIDLNGEFADHAVNRSELRSRLETMPVVSFDRPLEDIFRATTDGFSAQVERGNQSVWLTVTLGLTAANASDGVTNFILRSDLSTTKITYYGRKSVRDLPEWHDDWTNATLLPLLIKIETWQTDGTANPPLTIQPGKLTRQMEISLSSLVPPD